MVYSTLSLFPLLLYVHSTEVMFTLTNSSENQEPYLNKKMNKLENGQTSIVTQNKGSKSGDTVPFKVMYNPQEHCQHTLPDVLSPPFCNLILLKYLSMQEEGERGGEGNWKNCLSFSLLLSLNLSPFVLWTSRLGRGRGGQNQLYNLHKKV